MREIRIFVSSPDDAQLERRRLERVVERLNGELGGTALLRTVRWETYFYKAHASFQAQIVEASQCDVVVGILRHRLGTELPPDFPKMPSGEPYPSGTAYEVLSAIEAHRKRNLPDVYVFRYNEPPTIRIDDAERPAVEAQWKRLKGFFEAWFRSDDGQFRAAFHSFSSTDDFERQTEALLRQWLEQNVLKGRSVVWPIEIKGSPFRGLESFGVSHAQVFFGRSRDIERAVEAWKNAADAGTPYLLVIGPSGAGKSSLARAGLVPRLTLPGVVPQVDVWRVAAMRPGERGGNPFAALADQLLSSAPHGEEARAGALPEISLSGYQTPEELAALLAHSDATAAKPVIAALDRVQETERARGGYERPVRSALLLLIDQLDELFAADVTDSTRRRFAALMSELVNTGRVWLVATLRADLYERYGAVPELLALKQAAASYDLEPPGPVELAQIVREPARAADLVYEADAQGRTLDERLLADADRADMLPLLQFTLDRLFQERVTSEGETRLTHAAYDSIGGLDGALEKEAERALATLDEAAISRLPRLLRELATPAPVGDATAGRTDAVPLSIRSVPFRQAAHDLHSERLVRALVDARILLSSGKAEAATVRIAHQRVLGSWKRARDIVEENADFYRIREEVEDERRRWEASGRKRTRLIPAGLPLAEAESIVRTFRDEVSPEARAFIAASGRRARLRQRLTTAAAVVFLGLGAAAGYLGWLATERAEAERAAKVEAEHNFEAAKAAVDGITIQLAEGLRDAAGMQIATLRRILANIKQTVEQLSGANSEHLGMQESRALMLLEFGWTYVAAGDLTAGVAAFDEALAIFRRLAAADPTRLAWRQNVAVALEKIGAMRLQMGRTSAAVEAFDEAIEVDRALLQTTDDAEIWKNMALALAGKGYASRREGSAAAALAAFQEGLEIFRRLAADHPDQAKWRGEVASALDRIGDLKLAFGDVAGAAAAYDEGLDIMRVLTEGNQTHMLWRRDLTLALENVGRARLQQGDEAGALAAFEEGLSVARALSAMDPGNTQFRRDLSIALDRVGGLELHQKRTAEAFDAFEEALAIRRQLVEMDPANHEWQRLLSAMLRRICAARSETSEQDAAQAACAEALEIARQAIDAAPDNALAQNELALSLIAFGDGRRRARDFEGALANYQEALSIREALFRLEPESLETQRNLALILGSVGEVQFLLGDAAGALASFEQNLKVLRVLASADPEQQGLSTETLRSLRRIGDAKVLLGDDAGALAAFEEAILIARPLSSAAPNDAERAFAVVDLLGRIVGAAEEPLRSDAAKEAIGILDRLAARKVEIPDERWWRDFFAPVPGE
ncbi:MAG TPA: tetratricopeptide repeat protein [Propylenella sp.]